MKICNLFVHTALASLFLASLTYADPVPLTRNGPVALDKIRVNNPSVLPMTGAWKFKLDRGIMTPIGYRPASGAKIVTASSSKQGCQPEYALLDGDWHWTAENTRSGTWWKVDLGKSVPLSRVSLAWDSERGTYNYKVEGSADNSDWKTLAAGAMPGAGGTIALSNAPAQWLRVSIANSGGGGRRGGASAGLRHVKIFTSENGVEHEWKLPGPSETELQERNAFTQTGFDDSGWDTISVPSNWEMLGYSQPTYNGPDNAVGLYRKWVDVPASFAGKRILWHFDGVNNGAEIFVNGKPVTYHESGFTAFDADVTEALMPGRKNLVGLRVSKNTPSVDLDTGDFWCLGGIFRETYLLALPATHVEDITLVTDLDTNYHDATLQTTLQIQGPPGTTVAVTGKLYQYSGAAARAGKMTASGTTDSSGMATLHLSTPVAAPELWSAEKPSLYYVVFTLDSGRKTVEQVQERFGFRKIEIKDGIVLWNGQPVKCTGCCRHEIWPTLGKALNEEAWTTDLTLMKAANINAIRTSHYNFAQRFLELCDERGFYLLDEIPFCWCDTSDPALKPAFLQRARETLARDKNRAAVLAWSLGNENSPGPNVKAVAEYVHAADPTRLQFASETGPSGCPGVDLSDHHYPSFREMDNIARTAIRTKIPAIITENPHTYYTDRANDFDPGVREMWGEALSNEWSVIWPTKNIVGSFIWEWQDQALAAKTSPSAATGTFKDTVHKGIVDSYRKPRTDLWHVKMEYSPVMTGAREVEITGGKCAVILTNRYAFTDLAELTCHWTALAGEKKLAEGKMHVACPPGSSVAAQIPASAGMDTLRIEFIHPDGRNIYSALPRVKGTSASAPWSRLADGGPLKLDDQPSEIGVGNALMQLTVDKTTGLVQTWKVNGATVMKGGPVINFGEGAPSDSYFFRNSQPPHLKNPTVSAAAEGSSVRINVAGDAVFGDAGEPVAHVNYTLLVAGNAQIDVNWTVQWHSGNAKLRELGMKIPLPDDFNKMRWLRTGTWTDYPADHIGRPAGTASSGDVAFHANHGNTQWMLMSGDKGNGMVLLNSGQPLQARARSSGDATVLYASENVTVPDELARDLLPQHEINLRDGAEASGGFRLAAARIAAQVAK
jgi:beta-galactosidase/beta-glucuronidase